MPPHSVSGGKHDVSLLRRVARYTSGEAFAYRLRLQCQTILEASPQSLTRLTLRKRRETCNRRIHDVSLLWRVARYTSGEAFAYRVILQCQTIFEAPPQSSRLTLRKRRETCYVLPTPTPRYSNKSACRVWGRKARNSLGKSHRPPMRAVSWGPVSSIISRQASACQIFVSP